ncbi:hypothetical protein [Richelia sinica]|uniref:hypothetical protein n=1 Tax=Richelia sinica TaxID=1357545 RepID=UPI00168330BA|nr:hypothetical protein [Richelia sinica]MBD2666021.1 hypothetical protein [Richelia sinica FACHB-800]
MNFLKKSISLAKIFAFALSLLIFFGASTGTANAASGQFFDTISECVPVINGSFNVNLPGPVDNTTIIRSALVSLVPSGQSGLINSIVITGPDGSREFGCVNTKVQSGTDLIRACGGPAILEAGNTTYEAKGTNFGPSSKIKFCVNLSSDFQ